jgi:hypothetical protein
MVSFILNTGLFGQINGAAGLALSGTTLYVANSFANTITAYDAGSGAPIGVPPLIYGGGNSPELRGPDGLVISGNNFFVSNNDSSGGWIGEYTLAGATINDHFINTPGIGVYGLAISGNHLFVATGISCQLDVSGNIEECDINSGAVLNSSFVSGLQNVYGITISGTALYVSQDSGRADGQSVISTYDVNSGALLNANFVPGPGGAMPVLLGQSALSINHSVCIGIAGACDI